MSLFQSLEIDTLRLRNLIARTQDNRAYPSDFMLYAKGDGGTYWSTGTTARQFINLSTATSTILSTQIGTKKEFVSTTQGFISSFYISLYSTLYGYSSFVTNLSTYSVAVAYTDEQIAAYSTIQPPFLYSTFATNTSTRQLSTAINQTIISTNQLVDSEITRISSGLSVAVASTAQLSSFTNIFVYRGMSSINGSTFKGVQSSMSTLYIQSITFTDNIANAFNANLNYLSTVTGEQFNQTDTYPGIITSTSAGLNQQIIRGDSTTLASSNVFSSRLVSSLLSSLTSSQTTFANSLLSSVNSTNSFLLSTVISTSIYAVNVVNTVSTTTSQQVSTLAGNLSTLLSTGILDTIYQSFIQLQGYSEQILLSTISTTNNGFNSTVSVYTYVYTSSLDYINTSSYNFLVDNAYISSVSTLTPQVFSTMLNVISERTVIFNSTINGEIIFFETTISSQVREFGSSISSFLSTTENNVSTLFGEGISTQLVLYSTTIEAASTFIATANASSIQYVSTAFGYQFITAQSIILNSVDNLSTLTNVSSITGLSSITAGIATLDITTDNNFYILISDIAADVFYGIVFKDDNISTPVYNREINVFIDIQSSYSNKFFTLDLDNLSNWLESPKIINPASFALVTKNTSSAIPNQDTVGQVYLSTFLGGYLLNMRYLPQAMFVKNIYTYPYIYSQLQITSFNFPSNVECTNSTLAATSTFTYRGGLMPVNWESNDLNIPLGFKFIGTDSYGNNIIRWAGPYNSGQGYANVKVPGVPAPYVTYDTVVVSVYPNNPNQSGTNDGNINSPNGQIFDTLNLGEAGPLVVINPSLNCRVRVYNDGTNLRYLQLAEMWLNNESHENTIRDYKNVYARTLSVASLAFNVDLNGFGAQKAFDGNLASYFYGGSNAVNIDLNAFIQATVSSFSPTTTSTSLLSSLELYPGPVLDGLLNMKVDFLNWNEKSMTNGLFKSSMTVSTTMVHVLAFNASESSTG